MNAIFIFTRDRPEVLGRCLAAICDLNARCYVVDDSCAEVNQVANATLASQYPRMSYIGKSDFYRFLASIDISASDIGPILRPLGHREWNLGYARNLALLLSRAESFDRVLFLDDDIKILDPATVMHSFAELGQYQFVGARIEGMPDDSIVGHISTDLGILDPEDRMLSGGYIAFNPLRITKPFMNVYNEDWIWQLMHPTGTMCQLEEGVCHRYSDPYADFEHKMAFQETGEIIVKGMLIPEHRGELKPLTAEDFWENVLIKRRSFLCEVHRAAQTQKRRKYDGMIDRLLQAYALYDSRWFAEFFTAHSRTWRLFEELCSEM